MKFIGHFLSILLLFAAIGIPQINAQSTSDLRILVLSGKDGNPLTGANVLLYKPNIDQPQSKFRFGGSTDGNGLVGIRNIPAGKYKLKISFVGYQTHKESILLKANDIKVIEVVLKPQAGELQELVVEAERDTEVGEVGLIKISPEEIARVPAPGAAGDLISFLQTLPGVIMAGDRGGQLYIRGGTPVQNLVLVDNLPIVKPFHISNMFSAFPSSIVESADFYAGGFGAEYLGATSALLDVELRAGNMREYSADIGVGTHLLSLKAEGPVTKDYSSFLIMARKSVIDQTAPKIIDERVPIDFYDITARYTFRPEGYTCNVTGIRTFDRGKISTFLNNRLSWSNTVVGASCLGYDEFWDYPVEFTMGYSHYQNSEKNFKRTSRHSSIGKILFKFKHDGELFGLPIQYGFGVTFNSFKTKLADRFTKIKSFNKKQSVLHAFLSGVWKPNKKITVKPSVGTQATFPDITLEPRLRVAYQPTGTDKYEISIAGGRYFQTATGISDTRDAGTVFTVLKPINDVFQGRPLPSALQGMIGYSMEISNNLNINTEAYIIDRSNIPVAKWTPIAKIRVQTALANGLSYGFDARIVYDDNLLYLALSYGYAKTKYTAATGNLGAWVRGEVFSYYPPHDRRHKINFVGSYTFAGFTTNLSWEFGTGKPYTKVFGFDLALNFPFEWPLDFPLTEPGVARTLFSRPYGARLPAYHRLDVSIERSFQLAEEVSLDVEAGVINVYNRSNIFYFDSDLLMRIDQTSILPYLSLRLQIN